MSGTSFSYCVDQGQVNCSDPYSILIYAILGLGLNGDVEGATLQQITDYIPLVCPNVSYTITEVTNLVTAATKQGILVRGTPTTWAVNAAMSRVNPINAKYFCVGQYYKC